MKISDLNILVLGGNGFIGAHLVDTLIEQGCSVRVLARSTPIQATNINSKHLQYIRGSFVEEIDIAKAMEHCDVCFHLISTVLPKTSNLDPIFDLETNLIGSIRLLNHAVKAGVKKIIFLSSGGTIYGTPLYLPIDENHPTNPMCSYGIAKLAIEKYLALYNQLYGLDYTILRLSNPFGERQRVNSGQGAVAVFLEKAINKEPIEIWGNGSVIRDYIYISDVISAMLKSVMYAGPEHIFNIGSGQGLSLNEVLNEIEIVTGNQVERIYTLGRTFDVPTSILGIDRAVQELKWSPSVTFKDGLSYMMDWICERQYERRDFSINDI
ncbi:NAD-dependent epimerase/dehydratase family protein [Legionella sainthelensi]|uniref:NAD-dependent epimerase n=1 Tax=Legionella sainthelensi TaxID=28087 RepID=A0A2H5FHN8_9GAMM|nr:NAD-dependent epimerase/dehydratase family protein [Legionella sainthelensi]AUH71023.1 NAD-dependent epimerase/dehydratase family protein [Legionella sainthelensi]